MTLPQIKELFVYWKTHPPLHELFAAHVGFEAPKSVEQMRSEGAMSAADMLAHFKLTGGKIAGVGPR